MTPDELAKSGTEHGEQRALFGWAKMAEWYGFAAAWDDNAYAGDDRHKDAVGVPELHWLHAIPNGGLRDKKTAAKLKVEGVKRGISDVFLPLVMRGVAPLGNVIPTLYSGLYVELKRQAEMVEGVRKAEIIGRRAGTTSDEQNDFVAYARAQGYAVSVCFGWRAAAMDIQKYVEAVRNNAQTLGR